MAGEQLGNILLGARSITVLTTPKSLAAYRMKSDFAADMASGNTPGQRVGLDHGPSN